MASSVNSAVAVIPAGGSSTRMGGASSKLLLRFDDGSCVLERTLRSFLETQEIDTIVLPVPAAERESFEAVVSLYRDRVHVIEGGASRQESVWKGLFYCQQNLEISPSSLVLIHDAARCCVSRSLILAVMQGLSGAEAVFPGLPCTNSIKRVGGDSSVLESLDRTGLYEVQTPQGFLFSRIFEAHEKAFRAGDFSATDDAALIEPQSDVRMIPGEVQNIKVTTPSDFQLISYFSEMDD